MYSSPGNRKKLLCKSTINKTWLTNFGREFNFDHGLQGVWDWPLILTLISSLFRVWPKQGAHDGDPGRPRPQLHVPLAACTGGPLEAVPSWPQPNLTLQMDQGEPRHQPTHWQRVHQHPRLMVSLEEVHHYWQEITVWLHKLSGMASDWLVAQPTNLSEMRSQATINFLTWLPLTVI